MMRLLSFFLLATCFLLTESLVGLCRSAPLHTTRHSYCNFQIVPSQPSLHRMMAGRAAVESVSLAPLTAFDEDARFLAEAVRDSLDDEWIPQPCHAAIGEEVGRIYLEARRDRQVEDLNTFLVDVGTRLSTFREMESAFVGAWDVANQAADFMLVRLGRERCGCSINPTTPHFSGDMVAAVKPRLERHFNRYQWLRSVLEGDEEWDTISTVVALVMGFRIGAAIAGADAKSSRDESIVASGVKVVAFREAFGVLPPRLDAGALPALQELEARLPEEDTDEREALLDMVRTIHGEAATWISQAEDDLEFSARSIVAQWLIASNFLNDDGLFGSAHHGSSNEELNGEHGSNAR